jgi:hypothetical protein
VIYRSLHNLEGKYTLGKPLYVNVGGNLRLMLGKNTIITPSLKKRLLELNFEYLYVKDEHTPSTNPDEMVSVSVQNSVLNIIEECYAQVASSALGPIRKESLNIGEIIEQNKTRLESITVFEVMRSAQQLIKDIENGEIKKYGSALLLPSVYRITTHIFRTTVLSLLIARTMGRNRYEQEILVLACLLHDIGKVALGLPMNEHLGIKSRSEEAVLRNHPLLGKAILDNVQSISDATKTIVLNHHEYLDGSGYPRQLHLRSEQANILKRSQQNFQYSLAEILCVANDFDNFCWNQNTGTIDDRQLGLLKLRTSSDIHYDPTILEAAEKTIIPFPVASLVEIIKCADSKYHDKLGVVTRVDPEDPAMFELQTIPNSNKDSESNRIEVDLSAGDIVRRAF